MRTRNPEHSLGIGRLIRGVAVTAMLGMSAIAQANIVYDVNRTIGAGTLTGYIETDGTIGAIGIGNFVDWSLTLLAPDINGGAPSTIVDGSNPFTAAGSPNLSATASGLFFDHSINALLFAYTSSGDFWCLAGGGVGDTGCFAQGEIIGYSDASGGAAYVEARSGLTAFGSVAVPLPATWALFAAALGLMAFCRRLGEAA